MRTGQQATGDRRQATGEVRIAAMAVVLLAGCNTQSSDLQRMIFQAKAQAYEATGFFPDGRTMRVPPARTVPRERRLGDPQLVHGGVGDKYAEAIPVPVTRDLLARGQRGYDTQCAVCHGVRGDGESIVASNMRLRRPPSLIDPRVRAFPPGRVYRVATEGYGMMPPYDWALGIEDRWAVVAYLKALQLSQAVPLDTLPASIQDEARRALP